MKLLFYNMKRGELQMKLLLYNILLFSSYVYGSEICSPLNGVNRTCMRYQDCPREIQDLVAMHPKPTYMLKQLRDARCGEMLSRKLCCPTPECYTWDGRPGVCVKYNDRIFTETMSFRQIKQSRCMKKPRRFVCYSALPVRQTGVCESDISAFPPDPSYGCCGKDRVALNKILGGGDEISIDQFPWLAVIKYPEDKRNCTGVLISGKYVLTAAHCVDSMALHEKPYAVVLGEYDKSTNYDCDVYGDCHSEAVTIRIEDIKVHPDFNPSSQLRRHDIALIRLEEMVTYSDFILPICLPIGLTDTTRNPPANFKLWSAGWGAVEAENHHLSDVKLKVEMSFVNPWVCAVLYPHLWSKQICAGGAKNKSLCNSDPGSPLMHDRDGTFEILGISSYGMTKCSNDPAPAVYTKVYSYTSWIHSNIIP